MTRRGFIRAFSALAVLLTAPATLPAQVRLAEHQVCVQVGSEYRLWTYATGTGDVRAQEHYAPLDVSWRARPWFSLSSGADLLYRQVRRSAQRDGGTEPGEVRFSARADLLDRRLCLIAGGAVAMVSSGLTFDQANIAETLENTSLAFPWVRSAWGSRAQCTVLGQCVRRRDLIVQLGAGYERRSTYDLFTAGPRFRPGDLLRFAGEVQAARGLWLHELMLRLDRPGKSTLGPTASYRTGLLLQMRLREERRLSSWGGLGLALGISRLGSGVIERAPALDPAMLSGGSLLWGRVCLRKSLGTAQGELSMGGSALRGLPGDLGHATVAEPGLAFSRDLAGGLLRLDLRADLGADRAGGKLRGLGFTWSWNGGFW